MAIKPPAVAAARRRKIDLEAVLRRQSVPSAGPHADTYGITPRKKLGVRGSFHGLPSHERTERNIVVEVGQILQQRRQCRNPSLIMRRMMGDCKGGEGGQFWIGRGDCRKCTALAGWVCLVSPFFSYPLPPSSTFSSFGLMHLANKSKRSRAVRVRPPDDPLSNFSCRSCSPPLKQLRSSSSPYHGSSWLLSVPRIRGMNAHRRHCPAT